MTIDWRGWSRGQWALRLVVLIGPMVALYARGPAFGSTPVWVAVLLAVLAGAWALAPESVVGVVVLLVVGWSWAASGEGRVPALVLVAALGMLAAHLAALVLGYGPARLPVPVAVARLWALRGALVLLSAPVVWLMARGVGELPDSSTVWVLGLGVALSVVIVAVAALQALMAAGGRE
jgi:hypothetical protein